MNFLKELFGRYTLHEGKANLRSWRIFSVIAVSVFDFYADAHRVSSDFYR